MQGIVSHQQFRLLYRLSLPYSLITVPTGVRLVIGRAVGEGVAIEVMRAPVTYTSGAVLVSTSTGGNVRILST
jgi:ABC-type phosphate transport system permease subunit